jgi:Domain of unknown function (DUF4294)
LFYKKYISLFIFYLFLHNIVNAQLGTMGPNDTIPVLVYKINPTDSFAFYYMQAVEVRGILTENGKKAIAEQKRMRRYIMNVYPIAIKAAEVLNDIRTQTAAMDTRREKRHYRKANEKVVKDEFTDKIKNLCYAEGKVLCKLIYRETGETCYDIIKELKSGINARLWQTVSFFFDGNLKKKYDPNGEDMDMEMIVKEVARMYGRV